MTRHHDLDQALRAAAKPVASRAGQPPAEALLDRIVRSAPATASAAAAPVRGPRRSLRLAFAVAVTALVATGGAVLLPDLGEPAPAYASWTARPEPLPDDVARDIAGRCEQAPDASSISVLLGERRGDYAYVLAVAPDRNATCFRDRDNGMRTSSYSFYPASAAQLGRSGIDLYGWGQFRTAEGLVRVMSGRLGTDVTAVDITVRSADGVPQPVIHATVRGGYFLAWYPEATSGNDTVTTVTRRLADGTAIDAYPSDLMSA